jgi:hypothetical protein
MSASGSKAVVRTKATFLIFADRSDFKLGIGFIRLAPHNSQGASDMRHSALAITFIERNDEISSSQTTNKTRTSTDTAQNQRSSEGTRRFAARCPALENQE